MLSIEHRNEGLEREAAGRRVKTPGINCQIVKNRPQYIPNAIHVVAQELTITAMNTYTCRLIHPAGNPLN
jgi:hypothetical protein